MLFALAGMIPHDRDAMLKFPSLVCVALVLFCGLVSAREFTVLTYNVENLFDADGAAAFEDYKETGDPNSYSRAHVLEKIRTIGEVLQSVGNSTGPDVVLFNEIEIDFSPDSTAGDLREFLEKYRSTTLERMLGDRFNDAVRGLPSEALLLKHLEDIGLRGYHVAIGSDAADLAALEGSGGARGVKAQKNAVFSKFPITAVLSHSTQNARDILECTLDVDGKPFTVFVNHWKSGASDPESEVSRRENAKTLRSRLDEIFAADPAADVLVAGDFNSNYNQSVCFPGLVPSGLNDVLGSSGDEAATAAARGFSLYNLWYEVPPGERGSDHHRGYWGTLMQKIITPGLYDRNGIQYVDDSFERLVLPGVNAATPLELPRRWTNAGKSGGGASDHFPVLARFRTVEDGDKKVRVEPAKPGSDDGDSAERLKIPYGTVRKGDVPVFGSAEARDLGRHGGEIFFVRGKLVSEKPPVVEVGGGKFEVFAHDEDLREVLEEWERGDSVEFLGQLGLHKGREQFVVFHPDWISP
jgi:hypothetical protein